MRFFLGFEYPSLLLKIKGENKKNWSIHERKRREKRNSWNLSCNTTFKIIENYPWSKLSSYGGLAISCHCDNINNPIESQSFYSRDYETLKTFKSNPHTLSLCVFFFLRNLCWAPCSSKEEDLFRSQFMITWTAVNKLENQFQKQNIGYKYTRWLMKTESPTHQTHSPHYGEQRADRRRLKNHKLNLHSYVSA